MQASGALCAAMLQHDKEQTERCCALPIDGVIPGIHFLQAQQRFCQSRSNAYIGQLLLHKVFREAQGTIGSHLQRPAIPDVILQVASRSVLDNNPQR